MKQRENKQRGNSHPPDRIPIRIASAIVSNKREEWTAHQYKPQSTGHKLIHRVATEVSLVIEPLLSRVFDNLRRAEHLVAIYQEHYGAGKGRRAVHKADLLRAATVFLHATLEDLLRNLSVLYLPMGKEETLNRIPIVGSLGSDPQKFLLGKLADHRSKTVDQVIRESVDAYLMRSNYNNTTDIAGLLGSMNIPISKRFTSIFPDLQSLMERRHAIVHRADRVEGRSKGKQRASSLSTKRVEEWISAIREFSIQVTAFILQRELYARLGDVAKALKPITMDPVASKMISKRMGKAAFRKAIILMEAILSGEEVGPSGPAIQVNNEKRAPRSRKPSKRGKRLRSVAK